MPAKRDVIESTCPHTVATPSCPLDSASLLKTKGPTCEWPNHELNGQWYSCSHSHILVKIERCQNNTPATAGIYIYSNLSSAVSNLHSPWNLTQWERIISEHYFPWSLKSRVFILTIPVTFVIHTRNTFTFKTPWRFPVCDILPKPWWHPCLHFVEISAERAQLYLSPWYQPHLVFLLSAWTLHLTWLSGSTPSLKSPCVGLA